jgi:4,5-dihydroxyphthalate decarboxylase
MAVGAPHTFKTAIGSYPHTLPLKDGRVSSPRLCLDHVEIVPANRAFRPMVNQLAYDISEMALVTLLLAKARHKALTGVPVVLMQQSAYGMLLVRNDSPLRSAKHLLGKRIGVRAYTQTTGTWLRGMLHEQFDLDLSTLKWVTFEDAHVDGFVDPPNCERAANDKSLAQMLRDGEIDAATGLELPEHPDLRTLLPDALQVERDFIRQTGIRPINHSMVIRTDIVHEHRWIVDELANMVRSAKQVAGDGPADGLDLNRPALDRLARYAFEQGITPGIIGAEELYAA